MFHSIKLSLPFLQLLRLADDWSRFGLLQCLVPSGLPILCRPYVTICVNSAYTASSHVPLRSSGWSKSSFAHALPFSLFVHQKSVRAGSCGRISLWLQFSLRRHPRCCRSIPSPYHTIQMSPGGSKAGFPTNPEGVISIPSCWLS